MNQYFKLCGNFQILKMGFCAFLLIAVSGCSTVQVDELHALTTESTLISKRHYDVKIPSFDGTLLKATIFQPELLPHQRAPLILHAHGWGTWRMKGTVGLHATFMAQGKAGIKAWEKGYWVISFDQRGFGGSEGKVNIMNPEVEVQDAIAVIDWAAEHLPRLAYDDEIHQDPKIGMLGESYGGQLQLLASIYDSRIDALIPMTTWHDLSEAIAPDGHVKSFWTSLFFGLGTLTSGFDLEGELYQKKYLKTLLGKMTPEMRELLYDRSMASYCDSERYPQADILFIQGFRDTIFPMNHAMKNLACAEKGFNYKRQGKNDARLLVMQGGHILPTQKFTGLPIFNTEKEIHCENERLNLADVMVDWFDAKLLDHHDKVASVPKLCMTQDYASGISIEKVPVGGEKIMVENHAIRPAVAGMFEVVARPFDWLAGLPKKLFAHEKPLVEIERDSTSKGGLLRPAFIPLKIADREGYLSGVAIADLLVESRKKHVTLFAGLGIKKPDSQRITLLSEQLQPFSGRGYHSTELPGMSSRLERGDVIGLVVYGANSQYFLNRSFSTAKAEISGTIDLPLMRRSGDEYVAYSSPEPMIDNVASRNIALRNVAMGDEVIGTAQPLVEPVTDIFE